MGGGAGAARRGGRVSRREPQAVGPRVWSWGLWGLHVWEPVETRGGRGQEKGVLRLWERPGGLRSRRRCGREAPSARPDPRGLRPGGGRGPGFRGDPAPPPAAEAEAGGGSGAGAPGKLLVPE